jgi:hypothetical protein
VARIQPEALNALVLICAPSASTFGTSRIVQPSENVHSPLPDWVSDGPTGGRVIAPGAEDDAREVGMVAGGWGARYPAWPRVWKGQGFEPASN